jgi:guanylate kinase
MSGQLFIVSAPSGGGKTSLVRSIIARDATIELSVSYTTRPARPGEIDGRDYHFVTREQFEAMLERAQFLESALVHGNYYGTSEQWVRDRLAAGAAVILEIDWQGAAQIRGRINDAICIFILPPSIAILQQRLRSRAQDSAAVIEQRLRAAREEIAHAGEFDYVIINDQFDEALLDLSSVIRAAKLRTPVQLAAKPRLLDV